MSPALSTDSRLRLRKSGVKPFVVRPFSRLKGEVTLSGDKSIAHRAIIISVLNQGITKIENFPTNKDCLQTLNAFKKLGVNIIQKPLNSSSIITVNGKGLSGLSAPRGPIFVGDSGTTLRLLLGVLAGQNFTVKLMAGKSLSGRPMLRVTEPLRRMGAKISAQCTVHSAQPEEYPPITITGGRLKPFTYKMPIASAQVKSAILLAGLYTQGTTKVIELIKTRDHTERMLRFFKAEIKVKENTVVIKGNRRLVSPGKIYIPADISSASFFLVAAIILPNSQLRIKKVSLNPSRIGIINVLSRMKADIKIRPLSPKLKNYEPMGDIIVKTSSLKGTIVKKEEVPSLIDELPVLMVAGCFAQGKTIFEGVEELRVKETDRIRSMVSNLKRMGADIEVVKTSRDEKIIIKGVKGLKGAKTKSFGDHRTAMSMVVAGLAADGLTQIDEISCISKSFPDFFSHLLSLTH